MAPQVAAILARELGRDAAWERQQVAEFTTLAARYMVRGAGPYTVNSSNPPIGTTD